MLSLSSRTHSTDKSWLFRPRLCPFNLSPLSAVLLWGPQSSCTETVGRCSDIPGRKRITHYGSASVSPVCVLSHVQLFVTPWIVECQAPLSMGFSMQELKWVAISSSRGSSQLRMEPSSPVSPALQADSSSLSHLGIPDIIKQFLK